MDRCITLSTVTFSCVRFVPDRRPGADREGLAGVRTPVPPKARVRPAERGDVCEGGPAQPHLPAVLGLYLAVGDAAALVLRVQPKV